MPGRRTFRRELQQSQNDRNTPTLVGYEDFGGSVRTIFGDDDSPWLKTPPFSTTLDIYTNDALPVIAGPPVDVRDVNILTLYVDYTPADGTALLNITPFVWNTGAFGAPLQAPQWVGISVVDQALVKAFGTFSREIGVANFTTSPGQSAPLAQSFDVSPYLGIRFLFTETLAGEGAGVLNTRYNLSL